MATENMATEYEEQREQQRMLHKMSNTLAAAKSVFYVSLAVAVLVFVFKI